MWLCHMLGDHLWFWIFTSIRVLGTRWYLTRRPSLSRMPKSVQLVKFSLLAAALLREQKGMRPTLKTRSAFFATTHVTRISGKLFFNDLAWFINNFLEQFSSFWNNFQVSGKHCIYQILDENTIQDGIQANPGSKGYFIRANFTKHLFWERGGWTHNKVNAKAMGKVHVRSIKK